MHAVLLEKERVAVKMRHAVLKGDLVVLKRFRKAGAAALGDIGKHFPDTDEKYKGADSRMLLREVVKKVAEKGYSVGNADVTIVAQRPKMLPYIEQMRKNVADDLNVGIDDVNIKATTTEKLGFEGRGEGISATAVVLLK